MKFLYGNTPASPDAVYRIGGKCNGLLRRVDIMFDDFWERWRDANIVFIDFPYDDRMVKHYYQQIDIETDKKFNDLRESAFDVIGRINPDRVFVEIGKRNLEAVSSLLAIRYKTKIHPCFYAKKYPCFIVEGTREGQNFVDYQIDGIDELQAIDNICKNEKGCICDFFNGQGAVSLSAYKNGLDFVCSELNPNRLGKALSRLQKAGAIISELRD